MSDCSKSDSKGDAATESTTAIVAPIATELCKRKKAPSPRKCREFIRKQAADAMPDIVKAFVQEAKEGSVPHFNALTKVGGFDQRPAAEAPKRRRKSLGRQLLDELEKYEARQAAELAAENSQIDNGRPQERS